MLQRTILAGSGRAAPVSDSLVSGGPRQRLTQAVVVLERKGPNLAGGRTTVPLDGFGVVGRNAGQHEAHVPAAGAGRHASALHQQTHVAATAQPESQACPGDAATTDDD